MYVYSVTFSVGLDRSISEKLVDKKHPIANKIKHSSLLETSETWDLLACLLSPHWQGRSQLIGLYT